MTSSEKTFLFTSESVGEGHPDKICDQISDAILDAHLSQDPDARVACETSTSTGLVMVMGQITSTAIVNCDKVVRAVIKHIGYDDSSKGFDHKTCSVISVIESQSPDIASAVGKDGDEMGAGDQGLMFGYATDETEELMPLTLVLAHQLNYKMSQLRRNGELPWARPDSKTQVTCEYKLDNGACVPIRVHTVVVSCQHADGVSVEQIRKDLEDKVVKSVIPPKYLDNGTIYLMNPSGRFVIGGPQGDTGLTGRKIIADSYGGWGGHGGGAFSGKDFSKVDRSGAYAARWVAKSLVNARLCRRVLVQVAYAIGVAKPLAINIQSYGTATRPDDYLMKVIEANFDLRPGKIVKDLDLKRPNYFKTACYGHFGRPEFSWEQPKTLKLDV